MVMFPRVGGDFLRLAADAKNRVPTARFFCPIGTEHYILYIRRFRPQTNGGAAEPKAADAFDARFETDRNLVYFWGS